MLKKILFLSIFLGAGLALALVTSAGETSCPANTTVGETQATLVGEVTDDGGDPNLEVWFQYGRTTNYGSETAHLSQYGTGLFCTGIYDLTPCTTYNYRAVAKNSVATSYGANKSFTTVCIPTPTVDLKVNGSQGPITVSYRSTVTLSWSSTNAASCEASGDWSGVKTTSGSQTIQMNEVRAYNFTLTCQNSAGSKTATDYVTVNVAPIPPTVITKPAVVTY